MALSAPLRVTAPVLAVVDGIPTTTSVEVAKHFGKAHQEVLRRIRNLIEQLPKEHASNFAAMFIDVQLGQGATRQDPAYRITRDGFTLLAMGFTGKKALAFKLAYIDAFNRMESALTQSGNNNPAPVLSAAQDKMIQTAVLNGACVSAMMQQQITRAILKGGDGWKHQRWLVSFITDSKLGSPPEVECLANDTLVLTKRELVDLMATITTDAWNTMRNKANSRSGVPA